MINLRNSKIRQPEIYHGNGKRPPFFEGWYYKCVAADGRSFAIIPGIYKGVNAAHSTAFVMVLDGRTHQATFHRFPVTQFVGSDTQFLTRIGSNLFTADYLTLNLPNLQGHLTFRGRTPFPATWRTPGIMGWYAYFPMECYHGLISMDHRIDGALISDGEAVDFTGGRGYIEKDWGRNFPQSWVWIQGNHFEQSGTSLFASVARIPFYGRVFPGFIIALWHESTYYLFTTYNKSALQQVKIDGDHVTIVAQSQTHQLTIEAERGATALLHMPTAADGMIPRVRESVAGKVTVTLTDRDGNFIFRGKSKHTGVEIEGDTTILQSSHS